MKSVSASLLAVIVAFAALAGAQDGPELPPPTKEHEWLDRFVGEWTSRSEIVMEPGQEPVVCTGVEKIRRIGGFWIVADFSAVMMGEPIAAVLTLGYDPGEAKFVGTWVDSMTSHMWHYEGTLSEDGDTLTLVAEGPNPEQPGTTARFRDVIAFQDDDHKTMTSFIEGPDGAWAPFMTVAYERVR